MSQLFSPFEIKSLKLKNRLMRSATTSYWSDENGILRDPILNYYEKLARGGVGLIIKGHSYINKNGKAHTGQSGLADQKHVPRMKELTNIVHSNGVGFIAQLNHAGYAAKADRITASNYKRENWEARGATREEIEEIINDFAHSATIALQANFDGVQIHAAHGYLISQFLSNHVNQREDQYGGTLKNRARILLEVYDAIRNQIGKQTIIGVKLNCDDFAKEGGLRIDDSIQIIGWLIEKGIDFVEISGGGPEQVKEVRETRARADEDSGYYEATFAGHVEKIRKAFPSQPLAIVDSIRRRTTMDKLLTENVVDLISMSKPYIIEPDFPNRLANGQKKSACIDCGKCVSREYFGKMMLQCHYSPSN
ncbi:MAG: hypothetical protein GF308_03355 [Candidatus Heimdallarchaeota archaeon]|nr:hypothetical protein [Candidatus Heimdallarchaeota archaeon]